MVENKDEFSQIEKPKFKERNFLNKLILNILKIEIFFIPLFFWPFTFEMFEFNKQNILWFLTFLAVIIWLLKAIVMDKKIIYKRTPLDLPILIMLILWGLSAVFSVDWYSSLFGFYGRFTDAYISTVALALFYYLVVNIVTRDDLPKIFNLFLTSCFIIFITAVLSMSGLLNKIFGDLGKFNIIKANSFNLWGFSSEALALFASIIIVFIVALYSYNIKGAKKVISLQIKYYSLFFLCLFLMLLINFSLAWLSLLFSLAILCIFSLYVIYSRKEGETESLDISVSPALILFLLSTIFLFFLSGDGGLNLNKRFFKSNLPQEVVLNNQDSRAVVWQSFKDNPILGSGPGAFAYNFSKFRPTEFNDQKFWQLRFDKIPVYLLELLTTVGLLGLLSYLAVFGIFFLITFTFLKNILKIEPENCYLAFGFSFAVLALFIIQAMYLMNISFLFIFWLFMALAIIAWRECYLKIFTTIEIDLKKYKDLFPVFKGLIILLIIFFLFFSYLQTRNYIADVQYNNYRISGQQANLISAITLNKRRLNYRLSLSKDYLNAVEDEINTLSAPDKSLELDDNAKEKLQINIEKALEEAKTVTEVAPNSVMAWENLGAIYRDIRLIAVGANDWAIDAFKQASSLEPSNPVLLTELGKAYLAGNQTSEAVDALQKAIEQKPDYYDAYISLAKVYNNLGQTDKALIVLEEVLIKKQIPEVIYESGRLYYNQEQVDKAIERFQQAIKLRPNYSNAIYSLGLAFQKKGDKVNALKQFERVLVLNPENEVVQKLITELK